ncbi:MAG: class I SAM-dependent methyltransferase [bacterium]
MRKRHSIHPLLVLFTVLLIGCGGHPVHGPHNGPAHGHGHAHHGHGHAGRHHSQNDAKRFNDAEKWAKRFENPKRDLWQKPRAVLTAMALAPSHRVVDVGSATGYFTVRLARAVPQGRVWGFDVAPGMVRYLTARAHREKLPNLTSHLAGKEPPQLPQPVDRIFLCNTYHHIADRVRYFGALRLRLRPGGRLVIVDFKAGKLPVGPPPSHRVLPPQIHRELTRAGYRRISLDQSTLPYQFIAIYGDAERARPDSKNQ